MKLHALTLALAHAHGHKWKCTLGTEHTTQQLATLNTHTKQGHGLLKISTVANDIK